MMSIIEEEDGVTYSPDIKMVRRFIQEEMKSEDSPKLEFKPND